MGDVAYKLDLSRSRLNVHPVFHVSLLRPHHCNKVAFNVPPIDVEEDTEWELREKEKLPPDQVSALMETAESFRDENETGL